MVDCPAAGLALQMGSDKVHDVKVLPSRPAHDGRRAGGPPDEGAVRGCQRRWLVSRWIKTGVCLAFVLVGMLCLRSFAQDSGGQVRDRSGVSLGEGWPVAHWIWEAQVRDKHPCRVWRVVEIPQWGRVKSAQVRITADNAYQLWLDERLLGQGVNYRFITTYDLTAILKSGRHVLAVQAFNEAYNAGVILALRVHFDSGKVFELVTDETWWTVSDQDQKWIAARAPGRQWRPAVIVDEKHRIEFFPRVLEAPPILPVVLPFWQTFWFQMVMLTLGSFVTLLCLWLGVRLAAQRQSYQLLAQERERIARDIHDDFGARLTHLVLRGEVALMQLPAGSGARVPLVELSDAARRLRGALDEVIWAVSSRRDTLAHTVSRLCNHAESFFKDSAIRCRLDVAPGLPDCPLDLAIRRNLMAATKEALANSLRYSQAREVFVRMHADKHALIVVLEDDGVGFDPASVGAGRNGLENMALRMQEVGGTFYVDSSPGQGCRVTFWIPLRRGIRKSIAGLIARGSQDAPTNESEPAKET